MRVPPLSAVNSIDGVPALSALKSSSFVRCTANNAGWPATSGGYSMYNSDCSVQCVTFRVAVSAFGSSLCRAHPNP